MMKSMTVFRSANDIRSDFSTAMSRMYRSEVPAYGALIDIVETINKDVLRKDSACGSNPASEEDTKRISQERHGAIRLGTAAELAMIGRIFAVMGMHPVGYYDLSVASVPMHATAFRPLGREDLAQNPFRVFTSLLRLELIEDDDLRSKAWEALSKRNIFTLRALELTKKAEKEQGLSDLDAQDFVAEVLETFRWQSDACVSIGTFRALISAHRLIADIVSFKGPHINHLTPRTLDIDAAQHAMIKAGLPAKAVVEGPPRRRCPILLRQTAFKAQDEAVRFPKGTNDWDEDHHSARFGEIEQRGVALTPKGRALYDELLGAVRLDIMPTADGSNANAYIAKLGEVFQAFPDDWREMHDAGLAYFKYSVADRSLADSNADVPTLLDNGTLNISPLIYEDFLPVSAAGIFQSNLGDEVRETAQALSSQADFETALKKTLINEFVQYEELQKQSLKACLVQLDLGSSAA